MSMYLKLLILLSILPFWLGHAMAEDNKLVKFPYLPNSENPRELILLALKYENAEGVPQNHAKAATLYCKAAKMGDADAQFFLGWMYANGRGVSRSDNIASYLFTMAAKQGHEHAQKMESYTKKISASLSFPSCASKIPLQQARNGGGVTYPNDYIFKLVTKLAPLYEVDPKLVMAIISVESGFNVRAISPKNAQGLMQLIPATARRFKVKNTFDAEDNIRGGIAYLQWLLTFFEGNVSFVAAAYNSGEGTVKKYNGIPPYPETRSYVKKIRKLYKKQTHPYRPHVVGG